MKALTIAGSDSGGGAGIQADLKTFAALGVYGCSVITAITAQNTFGVRSIFPLSPAIVQQQLEAVVSDIQPDAIKIGMLFSSVIIKSVANTLSQFPKMPLVLDPVMTAKSGDPLLEQEAIEYLRTDLFSLADVLTPNIPEAEILLGKQIDDIQGMIEAARTIHDMGAGSVLLKGGHAHQHFRSGGLAPSTITDIFFDGKEIHEIEGPRISTSHTHGTGCTLSAAIASGLAQGLTPLKAIRMARDYLTGALKFAYPVGAGNSPLHHFYRWWGEDKGS
jgi:hydroxymethylpyrimidine/phosphomethylpyrimidine kinase